MDTNKNFTLLFIVDTILQIMGDSLVTNPLPQSHFLGSLMTRYLLPLHTVSVLRFFFFFLLSLPLIILLWDGLVCLCLYQCLSKLLVCLYYICTGTHLLSVCLSVCVCCLSLCVHISACTHLSLSLSRSLARSPVIFFCWLIFLFTSLILLDITGLLSFRKERKKSGWCCLWLAFFKACLSLSFHWQVRTKSCVFFRFSPVIIVMVSWT